MFTRVLSLSFEIEMRDDDGRRRWFRALTRSGLEHIELSLLHDGSKPVPFANEPLLCQLLVYRRLT